MFLKKKEKTKKKIRLNKEKETKGYNWFLKFSSKAKGGGVSFNLDSQNMLETNSLILSRGKNFVSPKGNEWHEVMNAESTQKQTQMDMKKLELSLRFPFLNSFQNTKSDMQLI